MNAARSLPGWSGRGHYHQGRGLALLADIYALGELHEALSGGIDFRLALELRARLRRVVVPHGATSLTLPTPAGPEWIERMFDRSGV